MKKPSFIILIVIAVLSGCASANQSSPDRALFVINGRPATKSQVDKLDKKQISEFVVLKGKAAKALYGKKAKHGAVLISTK